MRPLSKFVVESKSFSFETGKKDYSFQTVSCDFKMYFSWLLARKVACNTWDLLPLILELGFAITSFSLLCSQTKQHVK